MAQNTERTHRKLRGPNLRPCLGPRSAPSAPSSPSAPSAPNGDSAPGGLGLKSPIGQNDCGRRVHNKGTTMLWASLSSFTQLKAGQGKLLKAA
eukprot:8050621-Alexandrium_andersonii.AAC.1